MNEFTSDESWCGGNIDALMYFGKQDLGVAIEVTNAIWRHANLIGPFNRHDLEPDELPVINDYDFSDEGCEQLYGLIDLKGEGTSCMVQTTINDSDGLWVYIGPKIGSLPSEWEIGAFPFDDGSQKTEEVENGTNIDIFWRQKRVKIGAWRGLCAPRLRSESFICPC